MVQTDESQEISLVAPMKPIGHPAGEITASNTPDPSTNLDNQSSPAQRRHANLQLATLCWTLFLAGWNDGSTGPLLPRIQKVYGVCLLVPVTPLY